MDWHVVPRSLFEGSVRAVRTPVDAVVQLTGGRDPVSPARIAVDQAEAAARELFGRVTGDSRLVEDALRRREAAQERQRALELRGEAVRRKARADGQLATERRRAETRRKGADESADRQVAAAEAREQERRDHIEEVAERKRTAEQKAAEAREQSIEERERRARLASLDEQAAAVTEKEKALSSREEAERLEESTAAVKAARKSS